MNQYYELLYIVSLKYVGDELQKVMEEVAKLIKDNNGEISADEILGKQKLAYPIKNVHQGTYVQVEFNLPKENLKELDRLLRLQDTVLRYLITIKRIKSEQELEHEKKVQERLLKDKEQELAEAEGVKATTKAETVEKDIAKKEEKQDEPKEDNEVVEKAEEKVEEVKEEVKIEEKKKDDTKASLDDLDKKLDEILTDDIL